MVIPNNIIQKGKYTIGGEFVYKNTNLPYQGYYYIISMSYYVGKEFTENAPELIKVENKNKLYNNENTATYSIISGVTSQTLEIPKTPSIQPPKFKIQTRYFCRNITVQPINIKEISKETYDTVKNNPLFLSTYIDRNNSVEQAEKELPGLKLFLEG